MFWSWELSIFILYYFYQKKILYKSRFIEKNFIKLFIIPIIDIFQYLCELSILINNILFNDIRNKTLSFISIYVIYYLWNNLFLPLEFYKKLLDKMHLLPQILSRVCLNIFHTIKQNTSLCYNILLRYFSKYVDFKYFNCILSVWNLISFVI